jgi:hypothetical protein
MIYFSSVFYSCISYVHSLCDFIHLHSISLACGVIGFVLVASQALQIIGS